MLDTAKAVREIIAFHLGLAGTEMTEDATFAELGADSLDLYEVAMSLEEKFNIIVPDNVVEKLLTVGDAIAFVTEAGRAGHSSVHGVTLVSATRSKGRERH